MHEVMNYAMDMEALDFLAPRVIEEAQKIRKEGKEDLLAKLTKLKCKKGFSEFVLLVRADKKQVNSLGCDLLMQEGCLLVLVDFLNGLHIPIPPSIKKPVLHL